MENTYPLAGIEVPTRELHARYFAGGLTVYDYDTILAALQEMDRLVEEERQLLMQASVFLALHTKFAGDIAYAPKPIQKLDEVTNFQTPIFQTGNIKHGGRQEKWPVEKWQKQMATYRRSNDRIRKALKVCNQ